VKLPTSVISSPRWIEIIPNNCFEETVNRCRWINSVILLHQSIAYKSGHVANSFLPLRVQLLFDDS
jgi:hypothetical protein